MISDLILKCFVLKRVTIIGQDASNALKEVLKHRTVKRVGVYSSKDEYGCFFNSFTSPQEFGDDKNQVHKSDVVLVTTPDALDNDASRIVTLYDALSDSGVLTLVVNNGITDLVQHLQHVGFKSIHLYEEVCGFSSSRHCSSSLLSIRCL